MPVDMRLDHAQHGDRGDRGIQRVAAGAQHVERRQRRLRHRGGGHAVRPRAPGCGPEDEDRAWPAPLPRGLGIGNLSNGSLGIGNLGIGNRRAGG